MPETIHQPIHPSVLPRLDPEYVAFHNKHTAFVARQCKENRCVTICLDYRLAPENPYPAAVIDTVDALTWIHRNGKLELGANVNKIAIGGSSSGGNLAIIASLKAQQLNPPIPIVFQLLVVPVIDNTASDSGDVYPSWKEMKDTAWLNNGRMMWFRRNYLPDPTTWANWDNSPIFAPEALLTNAPPAWIGVCEMDILRDEGIAYGEKLRGLGVKVEIKVYERVPHQILGMDGVLSVARTMVADATKALRDAFNAA